MALTISQAGSATSTTASTSLAITPTVSFSVGDGVIVLVAADNSAVSGGNPLSTSTVTDSKSNTYNLVITRQQQGASQNNLACVAGFFSVLTSSLTTSDTITLNLPNDTTAKAAVVWQIVAGTGQKPNVFASSGTSPSNDGTAISRGTGTIGAGKACVLAAAIENNGAVTADSDTTRGSWSSAHSAVADSGTATTSMQVVSQYKIATTSGTQTWNVTFSSSSYAAIYLNFDEVAAVNTLTRTATGSGTGTEYAMIPANPSADDVTDFVFGFANTPGFREFEEVPNYTPRKVVYFASPYKTTQGFYRGLVVVDRTASAAGTGSSTALRLVVSLRTATGSGSGSSSTLTVLTAKRTAIGASESGSVVIGEHVAPRGATGSGQGTTADTAVGLHVAPRTATGSGAGSASATGVVTRAYTASSSGTGSATAVGLHVAPRTATGSGTGSSTSVGASIRARFGTDSAVGSSTAVSVIVLLRTVFKQSLGASEAVGVHIAPRIAVGSGTGTETSVGARLTQRTATGLGVGAQSAIFLKLFIFRTPTSNFPSASYRDGSIANRLFSYAGQGSRGNNVYKLTNGTFTEAEQRDATVVAKVYHGGHTNFVTQAEKDELVAAGYGSYVT